MTRTDVVASSRPQKADAAPKRKGSASAMRRLVVLPVAFALTMALVLPTTALAAEGLSGYNSKPTPTTGTSPSKEKSTPTKTTAPETTASEPTTSTEPTAKTATLPFTGFDLRWSIGGGVLLIAMGFSLVVAQRRQHRNTGR
jgi:hypothetical protein